MLKQQVSFQPRRAFSLRKHTQQQTFGHWSILKPVSEECARVQLPLSARKTICARQVRLFHSGQAAFGAAIFSASTADDGLFVVP